MIVLDLGLPDMSGIEVLEGLRGWLSAPVIVLSARIDSADKVEALDAGADDYVTKPFGMDELLARLHAAVSAPQRQRKPMNRRWKPTRSPSIGGEAGDQERHRGASHADQWGMLEMLVRNRGKLVGREELLREVWGPAYAEEPTTCASTWRSCVASWRMTRRTQASAHRGRDRLSLPGVRCRRKVSGGTSSSPPEAADRSG